MFDSLSIAWFALFGGASMLALDLAIHGCPALLI